MKLYASRGDIFHEQRLECTQGARINSLMRGIRAIHQAQLLHLFCTLGVRTRGHQDFVQLGLDQVTEIRYWVTKHGEQYSSHKCQD